MSKNAVSARDQKPRARISALASGAVLVLAALNLSPVIGASKGSTATFGHPSVMRSATISLTSLCRIVGKPPFAQHMAWVGVNSWPQVHLPGMSLSCQPCLSAKASLKSRLLR